MSRDRFRSRGSGGYPRRGGGPSPYYRGSPNYNQMSNQGMGSTQSTGSNQSRNQSPSQGQQKSTEQIKQSPQASVQQQTTSGGTATPQQGQQAQKQSPANQQTEKSGSQQQATKPGSGGSTPSETQNKSQTTPAKTGTGQAQPQKGKGNEQTPTKQTPQKQLQQSSKSDNAQPKEVAVEETEVMDENQGLRAAFALLRRPGEKTYTQRCRLFVGNLPIDITDEEFRQLFAKYGEPGEVFINKSKGFGFIKLETRALADIAKAELDDMPMRGRQLRVRFATHSAALSVKNLSPFVSNELLEEAFSTFGQVERAIVIVDDRGRSTGKGIVEFSTKPAAKKAFERCNEGVFLLTTTPMPVIVEPLEQFDNEDGLPEKLAQKNPVYIQEREQPARFAQPGTFEFEYALRWKALDDMEKQQREQVEKNMKDAKEKLEGEMEDAYHEHQANLIRQDLMRRQEELRRMEEMHNQEMQKRKEMQLRQEEERRRRDEELILRQRELEEQLRRQREDTYSRMGYSMDQRERDLRLSGSQVAGDPYGLNASDPYSTSTQKYSATSAASYDSTLTAGATSGTASGGSGMSTEMHAERYSQAAAGSVPAASSRGMGSGSGFGRGREEYEGPNKKARY